jgi:hypothetical protein
MRKLIVALPSNRDIEGTVHLEEDGRILAGPFPVCGRADSTVARRHGNPTRNPLLPFGDTPLGLYRVLGLLPSGFGTALPKKLFGPHSVLVLQPVGGDAALADANGRFHTLIQGGKESRDKRLLPTNGSLRLRDKDQKKLLRALGLKTALECECEVRAGAARGKPVAEGIDYELGDPLSGKAREALRKFIVASVFVIGAGYNLMHSLTPSVFRYVAVAYRGYLADEMEKRSGKSKSNLGSPRGDGNPVFAAGGASGDGYEGSGGGAFYQLQQNATTGPDALNQPSLEAMKEESNLGFDTPNTAVPNLGPLASPAVGNPGGPGGETAETTGPAGGAETPEEEKFIAGGGLQPDVSPGQANQFINNQKDIDAEKAQILQDAAVYQSLPADKKRDLNRKIGEVVKKQDQLYFDLDKARLKAAGASDDEIKSYQSKSATIFTSPIFENPSAVTPAKETAATKLYNDKTLGRSRDEYAALAKAAKKGRGSNQVAAGLQSNMDCGIFALANAAETPYGVTAAIALGKVKTDYSLPVSVLKSPDLQVTKLGGLSGFDMLQTARALGEVNAVPAKDIPTALAQNPRPVVVRISNQAAKNKNRWSHWVAVSRVFKGKDGTVYYQVLDSEAKKTKGIAYWKKSDMESLMVSNGLQVLPPKGKVPKLMGGSGNLGM